MRDEAARHRERRALDAFDAALTWPEEERTTRLQAMLADDIGLVDRVARLLAAQDDAHLMRTSLPEPPGPAQAAVLPERVGVWRLAGQIGQGGMGTVHRGVRVEGGFEQAVAIKLIRGGLFSGAAAMRFAQERDILARLHHPHITRLYDGGVTADGQSYIVMELLGGLPITAHADRHGLDLQARLALLGDVCDAVGYAHQQGVVHADIKPSNVLIDPTHGVKLLDFGISAMAAADYPAAAACTDAYASPQQRHGARPVPADDVFALGCLLAALTAGCGKPAVSAELHAVIGRARAADARDRYASCGALADDLSRLRRSYPVRARPITRWRGLAFFWRRHRVASAAALAASAGLVAGLVVTTTLEIRAQAARAQADRRFVEVRALSRYLLDEVTDQLQAFPGTSALRRDIATRSRAYLEGLSRVPGAAPAIGLEVAQGYTKTGRILGLPDVQGMGDAPAAKQDLHKAETALRAMLGRHPGDADIATALAQTLNARAAIARTVDNDAALAQRLYDEAVQLTAATAGHTRLDSARLAQAQALTGVAELLDDSGRVGEMATPLDRAAADLAGLAAPDRVPMALLQAQVQNLRGDALYYLGDVAGSLTVYRQAAATLDGARGPLPDMRLLERSAFTSWNVAAVLDELGRHAEGLAVIERGVADAEMMRLFENSTRARHVVDVVHTQRAEALASVGRFDEAVAQARAELAAVRATAAASPGSFEAARSVPVVLRPVGEVYLAAGRHAEACAAFGEAKRDWQALAARAGVTGFDTATEMPLLERESCGCGPSEATPAK